MDNISPARLQHSVLLALLLCSASLVAGKDQKCPPSETWLIVEGYCAADYSVAVQQQEADLASGALVIPKNGTHRTAKKPEAIPTPVANAPLADTSTAAATPSSGSSSIGPIPFLLLLLYFLPAVNAYWKRKRNADAILLVNLFLGWTIVGWIVALIWSATNDPPEPVSEASIRAMIAAQQASALTHAGSSRGSQDS